MDLLESATTSPRMALVDQVVKTVISSIVGLLAGKATENAYEKLIVDRRNKTVVVSTDE